MSRFIRERYKGFESYTPGEQPKNMEYVKLNTNESPFPPAPAVLNVLKQADMELLRLYPDPTGAALKEKLAALYGVRAENVFLSNGSDDILNFAVMAFCDDGETLVFPDITYSFYDVIAGLHGAKFETVPLKDDMSIDPADYCGIGKNIFIPNPNAPTGMTITLGDIENIVKTNPDNIVLIDEAYVDFGADSAVPLTEKYDNLIVSQTFSKSRSFAGGRLGFAIANSELIDDLEKMKYSTNPYNVNRLTMRLAEVSVDENDYYMENCKKIEEIREYTVAELEKLGFSVLPSKANFVFAKHETASGTYIYEKLKENGVLVRHFTAERIKNYNRITIGSREQMDTLIERLKMILGMEGTK